MRTPPGSSTGTSSPATCSLSENGTVQIADFDRARKRRSSRRSRHLGTAAYRAEQRRASPSRQRPTSTRSVACCSSLDGPYADVFQLSLLGSSSARRSPSRRSASCAPTCRRSSRRPSCTAWPAGPNTGPPAAELAPRARCRVYPSRPPSRPAPPASARPRSNRPLRKRRRPLHCDRTARHARPRAAGANDVAPLRHRRGVVVVVLAFAPPPATRTAGTRRCRRARRRSSRAELRRRGGAGTQPRRVAAR